MKSLRSLALVLVAGLSLSVSAQETWNAVASPTTQSLWSVCYGGGQFVAVGEAGTILASTDGITWTPRVSGFPSRWLVGVGYGNGLYVAVGEAGLILTSPDATTWTPRHTTGTRINAVAYGNGMFLAVDDVGARWTSLDGIIWTFGSSSTANTYLRGLAYGEPTFAVSGLNRLLTTIDGTLFDLRIPATPVAIEGIAYGRKRFVAAGGTGIAYVSRDGITWSLQPSAPVTGVRGLAFFNNRFVAVGNDGVISTSFDGSAWTAQTSGTSQILLAAGGNNDALIAVGAGGTILRSLASHGDPVIVANPSSVTEAVGGNVAFTVTVSGAPPFTYQWMKNINAIPNATGDTLYLENITAADAANYSVRVTSAFRSITSSAANLTVVNNFPPPDPVDPTFTVNPNLNKAPRTALVQPDGKIIIGGDFLVLNSGQAQYGLARLNPDGSLDTSFKPGSLDPAGAVQSIALQPDGKILVGGTFGSINGNAAKNLFRLNADGSFDSSFSVGANTPFTVGLILVVEGGKIVLATSEARLMRLNPDGSLDGSFLHPTLFADGVFLFIQRAALQPDGKIVVATGTGVGAGGVSTLRRFNADGSADSSFANPSLGNYDHVRALRLLPDGRMMVVVSYNSISLQWRDTVLRFTSTGAPDPSFKSYALPDDVTSAAITADGRTYLSGTNLSSTYEHDTAYRQGIVRLNADGAEDFSYSLGAGLLTSSGAITGADFLVALDDGRLLAGGNFVKVQTTSRSYFARLVEQPNGAANAPVVVDATPRYIAVREGESFPFQLRATGENLANRASMGVNHMDGSRTLNLPLSQGAWPSGSASAVSYFFAYDDRGYKSTPVPVFVRVLPAAPLITQQPVSVQSTVGRITTLTVSSTGSGPITYQWFKDGNPITITTFNPTTRTLTIASTTLSDAGDYTVVMRNSLGFTTSETVRVSVNQNARLSAISTRALVGTGERIAIAGFVVQGNVEKRVLLRGVGPGLAARFGLGGALVDPLLRVYDSNGLEIATNSGWSSSLAAQMDALGLFKLDAGSKDTALVLDLPPGTYTAQLSSANGGTGIGLIEIYENDNRAERLLAISTRAFIGTGDGLAIPGISVSGPVPKKILVRAVGPGAVPYGIAAPLADPILTLVNSITGATIATNDDWSSSANKTDIITASAAAGEFPLPDPSKDAVLLVTVPPGNYTALVRGANGGTGVALVEVYEVP